MFSITTRTHGIMDLVYGATFIAMPFILKAMNNGDEDEDEGGVENKLLPAMGVGILAQGLTSDHEFGVIKYTSMPMHLTMDIGLGAFMVAAPYIINMDRRLKAPLVALGIAEIGLALLTRREPSYKRSETVPDHTDPFIKDIIGAMTNG